MISVSRSQTDLRAREEHDLREAASERRAEQRERFAVQGLDYNQSRELAVKRLVEMAELTSREWCEFDQKALGKLMGDLWKAAKSVRAHNQLHEREWAELERMGR